MMKLLVLHTSIILLVASLPLQSEVVAAFSTVNVGPKKSSRIRNHRHRRVAAPPAAATMKISLTAPPSNENDGEVTNNNSDRQAQGGVQSRRSVLSHYLTAGIIFTFSSFSLPDRALAASSTIIDAAASSDTGQLLENNVYFGAGCFWHVQHEMISAERKILNRKDTELTSLTGYAGGTNGQKGGGTDNEGRVCYHNFQSIADYGQLGHGEVVGMTVPKDTVGEFAEEYFKLFGTMGERADPMDKGGEYR